MRLGHGRKHKGHQLVMEEGHVIDSRLVIGRRASSFFLAHSLLIYTRALNATVHRLNCLISLKIIVL